MKLTFSNFKIFLNHFKNLWFRSEKNRFKDLLYHDTENEVKNSYPQIPRRILPFPPLSLSLYFSFSKKSTPLHFSRCNNAISGHGGPVISSRRHLHDTTSNQPNTSIGERHVASSASKTRVDAWASLSNPRTVGGHVCSLFAAWNGPRQSAKTPVNNASIRYIGHCACTTLGCSLVFRPFGVFFFLLFHCSLSSCNSSRTFSP